MQRLRVKDLKPGMLLNEYLYNKYGAVILPKGTRLTEKHLEMLKTWGIVYAIFKPGTEIVIKEKENPKQAEEAIRENRAVLRKKYSDSKQRITSFMEEMREAESLTNEKMADVEEVTDELLTYALSAADYASLITEMKAKDTYTYQHSINTAVYAALIGKWLNMDTQSIRHLGKAAVLHDIGKMKVPDEILYKPDKLTEEEFEEIKKHSEYGYNMIRHSPSEKLDHQIALAVLQHHERNNGRGYPLKVESPKIHQYAKIIAVTDVFDALTSDRCYGSRYSPFTALKEIRHEAFTSLDPHICLLFYKHVMSFFTNAEVVLNTGDRGRLVYFHENDIDHPIIKVGEKILDLGQEKDLAVQDVKVF